MDDSHIPSPPGEACAQGALLPEQLAAAAARAHARVTAHPEREWPADIPHPASPKTPHLLRELGTRLGRYLRHPTQWLPQLNAANGSARQQRSERRIACVQLARALIKRCDLATLRVGVPGEAGWTDFTLEYFAAQAGLPFRRAERALRDLRKAGLVRVRRQCELEETEQGVRYKPIPWIRYLTPALFRAMGLDKRLRDEQSRAQLRAQRKTAKARKQSRKGAELAAQLVSRITELQTRSTTPRPADAVQRADVERAIHLRAGELKAAHPEWDRDACYAAARSQLSPPGD